MPKIAALPRKPIEKPAADGILCAGPARQASGGTRLAPKKWQPGPTQFRSNSGHRRTYCFLSSQSPNDYTSYRTRRIRLILTCRSRNGKRQFHVNAAPDSYLKFSRDFERLRKLPGYLALSEISSPPQLSDLKGFTFERGDII